MPESKPKNLDKRIGTQGGALDKRITPENSQATFQQQLDQLDKQRLMIEAKARPQVSFSDRLLQPENLIKLGLAAAGAMSGNEDLMYAGAGLGMGTLGGASKQVAEQDMKRQQEIDRLTAMVDKQQQRLVTLLQSQPGLYVDEAGNNISTQEEWADILPLGVPFSPSALVRRQGAGGKDPRVAASSKLIDDGISLRNPVMLTQGLQMFSDVNNLEWTPEYIKSMAYTAPENFMDKLLEAHTALSVAELVNTANDRGISIHDPSLQGILVRKPETPIPVTVEQQEVFEAKEKLREWLLVDDNLAQWEKNPYDALDVAFQGDPVSLAALQDNSQYFNRGTRADEMRLKAEADTWTEANKLMLIKAGGLTASGAERKKIQEQMSGEIKWIFDLGRDIVTLSENKQSAQALGAQYAASRGIPDKYADYLGSQIVVAGNGLMREDGLEPHSTPKRVKDLYYKAAAAYQDALYDPTKEEAYTEAREAARKAK